MHQSADSGGERPLGTFSLTILVVASMIGAGVFTTSGFTLADLRDPRLVLLAWLVGGLIACCGAVSYGQLAHRLTENGGEYLFLSRFVHPIAGFMAGWVSFLAGFTGAGAFAAKTFETYALGGVERPDWLPAGSLAVLLVVVAALAHALHTGRGVLGQNLIVVVKLGLLAAFMLIAAVLAGRWQGGDALPDDGQAAVGMLAFATSVTWISLSYSGFNAAIYVAGEARSGASSVARAMWMATAAVTVLYLLLNAIFVYAAPADQIVGQPDVARAAAESVGGYWLALLVRIAICFGLASSVSSVLMAGPRVYAKMAEDGLFPKFFTSIQSPPTRSVMLQAIAIIVVLSYTTFEQLLSYLGITLAISASLTVGCLLWPQVQRERVETPKKRVWEWVIPLIYVVGTLFLAALTSLNKPQEAIAAGLTIGCGIVAFGIYATARRWSGPKAGSG